MTITPRPIRDKRAVYFTYYGHADHAMRCSFMMEWWQENFHAGPSWRGQMFRTDPLPYIKRAREAGLRVIETREEAL